MSIAQEPVFIWLSQFAYEPTYVYLGVVVMMLGSAFGIPIPEEVTLISVGLLAYMGAHPDQFPPPYVGAPVVNVHEAALIAFIAIILCDFLIYGIGRFWGRKLLLHPRAQKMFPQSMLEKVESWTKKYGAFACFIFRFTPGIRFVGHLACGMMKFEAWKFFLIDSFAAAISVPTQIYLLAYYGEPILKFLKEFKFYLFIVLILGFTFWGLKKLYYQKIRS